MKEKKLPKEFKKYFWDVDFKKISFKKYYGFVLERVMQLGDTEALRWLLNIPKKDILSVVSRSREIDPKTRNFWRVFYGK